MERETPVVPDRRETLDPTVQLAIQVQQDLQAIQARKDRRVTQDQLGTLEELVQAVIEDSQDQPDQQASLGELVTRAKLVRRVRQACQALQAAQAMSDSLESLVQTAIPDRLVRLEPMEELAQQVLQEAQGILAHQATLVTRVRQALLATADELATLVRPEIKELRDLTESLDTQEVLDRPARPASRERPG